MNNRKPRAFFSCSLNPADYHFNAFIETIIRNVGFEPTGTLCKYTFSPQPIPKSMREELELSDCLIIAATPRYFQKNIHNNNESFAMSEVIHVEAGMAYMKNIPILIFKAPQVDVGNFLPSVTQFIDPIFYDNNQYGYDVNVINNYFENAYKIIKSNCESTNNKNMIDGVKTGLGIIGGISILNFLFNNEE